MFIAITFGTAHGQAYVMMYLFYIRAFQKQKSSTGLYTTKYSIDPDSFLSTKTIVSAKVTTKACE